MNKGIRRITKSSCPYSESNSRHNIYYFEYKKGCWRTEKVMVQLSICEEAFDV